MRWLVLFAGLLVGQAHAQMLETIVNAPPPAGGGVTASCSPPFFDTNTVIINTSNAVVITCAR